MRVGDFDCPLPPHPGLKERATSGGQIVTALKMVFQSVLLWILWLLWAPIGGVLFLASKSYKCWCHGVSWITRLIGRFHGLCRVSYRSLRSVIRDTNDILYVMYNKRVKWLINALGIVSVCVFGPVGVLYWALLLGAFIMCFIPRDIRDIITFKRKLEDAWNDVLEEAIETDLPDKNEAVLEVPHSSRRRFACKLATKAIARVGLLKPTKANALVYQKVVLDVMSDMNVRCVDRLQVLPIAVAACLDRPKEVAMVERCISYLSTDCDIY